MTFSLHGIGASKGIAIGKVHVVTRGNMEVPEYTVEKTAVEKEVKRFKTAIAGARADLAAIKGQIPPETATDIAAFIDTHLLMLDDTAITKAPIKIIREQRQNAEWALKLQRDALVSVFEAMEDSYLRTRKDDIDHVVNSVQLRLLHTEGLTPRTDDSFAGKIVFADDLTPADTVLMQHQGVAAFVTEFGGPNSHTAILARSLRIPAVVGLHNAGPYLRDRSSSTAGRAWCSSIRTSRWCATTRSSSGASSAFTRRGASCATRRRSPRMANPSSCRRTWSFPLTWRPPFRWVPRGSACTGRNTCS
jgi:phosphotransferase system enzyme I (PtsI)